MTPNYGIASCLRGLVGRRPRPNRFNIGMGDWLNWLMPWGTSGRELLQSSFANARVTPFVPNRPPPPPALAPPRYTQDTKAAMFGPPRSASPFVAPSSPRMNSQMSGIRPHQYRYDASGGKVDVFGNPLNVRGDIVAGNPWETHVPTNPNTQMYRPRRPLAGFVH